jgi:hypothetical protein
MKKRENPMKKQALGMAVAFLVCMATASGCYAQRSSLVVNIPFAFHAGDKTLPAGEYRVESMPTGDGILHRIECTNCHALAIVPSLAVEPKSGPSEARLIFHRYGDSYFLSEIWTGQREGRQLFESKGEKEAAGGEARIEVALLAHSPSAKR